MSYRVTKNEHVIDLDTRSLISVRYKRITKAVNQTFWNSISDTAHSFYVGSYGRGTAINTSDLDVLMNYQMPNIITFRIYMEMDHQDFYSLLKMQYWTHILEQILGEMDKLLL